MHIIMAIAKTSHRSDEADRVNLPAWSKFRAPAWSRSRTGLRGFNNHRHTRLDPRIHAEVPYGKPPPLRKRSASTDCRAMPGKDARGNYAAEACAVG